MDWYAPLFPNLHPRLMDPCMCSAEKIVDEDAELTQLENEHTAWLNSITQKNCDVIPIGKTAAEVQEDDDDDDDEEDNDDDDDDTDTHDDEEEEEVEMEVSYNQ